jgi:hypothetical protein
MKNDESQTTSSSEAEGVDAAKKRDWLDFFNPQNWLAAIRNHKVEKTSKQDELKASSVKDGRDTHLPAGQQKDFRIYDPFQWVKPLIMWTNIQIILLLVGVICVWLVVYKVSQREYMVIDLPNTIQEQISTALELEQPDKLPALNRFLLANLTVMNTFSFEQSPNMAWLQGTTNPDIITRVKRRYSENQQEIRDTGMLQNLTITKIEDVFVSYNKKQLTANIRGYLSRTMLSPTSGTTEPQTLPYRARAVILLRPQSKLSSEPFYLLQIAEAAGQDDVRRFDKAIAEQRERKGL